MKAYLCVIFTHHMSKCFDFYTALGFELSKNQHDGGPEHFSMTINNMVFELYPCAETTPASHNRFGFEITAEHPRYEAVRDFLDTHGNEVFAIGEGKKYCVIKDPDQRDIEVVYPE